MPVSHDIPPPGLLLHLSKDTIQEYRAYDDTRKLAQKRYCIGAGLSVSGCCFQAIFSNPLASPDTLGVSSGAAFGAAMRILLSLNLLGVQVIALGFGVLAIVLTFLLSRLRQDSGVLMVVLAGVISSAFFKALISAAKYLADPLTKLPEITY